MSEAIGSAKDWLARILPGISLSRLSGRRTVRHCPICSWKGRRFDPGGPRHKQRLDARCPRCGSLERHRLAYLVANELVKLDYARVLHVAPEKQISRWLQEQAGEYLSIDLYAAAMARMDITNLDLDDGSRTLVWVSHVLEHVENDRDAIAEIYRVLIPGGMAFIQVPVWREKTFEDFSLTSADDRKRAFYQKNHVRLYGMDIVDRFKEKGFSAMIFRAQEFGPDVLIENGLSFASTNEVFVFQKPSASSTA